MSNSKYDATFFDPETGHGRLVAQTEVEITRGRPRKQRGRHVAQAKTKPLWAKLLAALIVAGFVFWIGWGIGAMIDNAATAAECRQELQAVLDAAGSDRAPTSAEVEICVSQR